MSHSSGNDVISAANVRSRVTVLGWKSKRRVDLDEESFNSVLCGLNHLLLLQMEMPSWRCVVDRKCVPDRMSLAPPSLGMRVVHCQAGHVFDVG